MTQKISHKTIINRVENVLDTKVDDKTILLSIDSGNYIELNKTASAIWSMINGQNDIATITQNLNDMFTVDRAECEEQVYELIDGLLNENLVHIN